MGGATALACLTLVGSQVTFSSAAVTVIGACLIDSLLCTTCTTARQHISRRPVNQQYHTLLQSADQNDSGTLAEHHVQLEHPMLCIHLVWCPIPSIMCRCQNVLQPINSQYPFSQTPLQQLASDVQLEAAGLKLSGQPSGQDNTRRGSVGVVHCSVLCKTYSASCAAKAMQCHAKPTHKHCVLLLRLWCRLWSPQPRVMTAAVGTAAVRVDLHMPSTQFELQHSVDVWHVSLVSFLSCAQPAAQQQRQQYRQSAVQLVHRHRYPPQLQGLSRSFALPWCIGGTAVKETPQLLQVFLLCPKQRAVNALQLTTHSGRLVCWLLLGHICHCSSHCHFCNETAAQMPADCGDSLRAHECTCATQRATMETNPVQPMPVVHGRCSILPHTAEGGLSFNQVRVSDP